MNLCTRAIQCDDCANLIASQRLMFHYENIYEQVTTMMMLMHGYMCTIASSLLGPVVVRAVDDGYPQQLYTLIRLNARLPVDATTATVNAVSLIQCSFSCLQLSTGCNGFNYNSQTSQCELTQQSNINEASLQSMSGVSFYRKVVTEAVTTAATTTVTANSNPCQNGGNVSSAPGSTCSCAPGYRGTNCEVDCTECKLFDGYSLTGSDWDSDKKPKTAEACWAACRKLDVCYSAEYLYYKSKKTYECFFKTIPFLDDDFGTSLSTIDQTDVLHTVCAFNCRKP